MSLLLASIAAALAMAAVDPDNSAVPYGSTDPSGTWERVWSDEFNGASLEPERWLAEDAAIMNNKELQYYTPDAVHVLDGHLVIRAEKRRHGKRDYTSGLIDSRGKFSMAFGRFECRAKLPRGQGMWPAFWMLPDDERWPPEIDIMENLGQDTHRVHTTHHWGPSWPRNQKTGSHFDGPDFSADFHVFAVEWSPEKIEWFIDGVKRFTSTTNIPQDPMYLILNLAVGGNWGGNPDDSTVFPQELRVDWVRVFRRTAPGYAHLLVQSTNGAALPESRRWDCAPGEAVTLHAVPNIGYRFKQWSGDASGANQVLTLQMDANRRVSPEFERFDGAPALLSRNKSVIASASEGFGFEPERAVDGSLWSRWACTAGQAQWLQVDLGADHQIDAVRLAWASGADAPSTIEVSPDAKAWTLVHSQPAGGPKAASITGLAARGRYVRFASQAGANNKGCSLFSFEIYGR